MDTPPTPEVVEALEAFKILVRKRMKDWTLEDKQLLKRYTLSVAYRMSTDWFTLLILILLFNQMIELLKFW